MINFIDRLIFCLRLILNKNKEPLYSFDYVFNYLKNGYFFPGFEKQDFRKKMKVESATSEKYVLYNKFKIAYSKKWDDQLIINNFNNIVNEQTATEKTINPHKYIAENELKPDWIVYDIGAAEGFQSKKWIGHVSKIVVFEPAPSFFEQLKKTFAEEVASEKVILINRGISDTKKDVLIENKNIVFDNLLAMITEYNLPLPNYIKADIEGEEINLLNAALPIFQKGTIKIVQVTTYHRPTDHIDVPAFFKQFNGTGYFSEGVMIFNRDGLITSKWNKKIYHPAIRKCLYTFKFS